MWEKKIWYVNRSYNRGRRPQVLGSVRTHDMGQFSIFRFAPSWRHIFALLHERRVGSRVYVVTLHDQKLWELRVFTAKAGNKGREEEPGLFYARLRSELIEKMSFSGSKISRLWLLVLFDLVFLKFFSVLHRLKVFLNILFSSRISGSIRQENQLLIELRF